METMMGSADARTLLDDIIESLLAHRRAVIDEEITYSDLIERLHHLKIVIRIKAGSDERDEWPYQEQEGPWTCTVWGRRDDLKS